jgi:hypothetical protein
MNRVRLAQLTVGPQSSATDDTCHLVAGDSHKSVTLEINESRFTARMAHQERCRWQA